MIHNRRVRSRQIAALKLHDGTRHGNAIALGRMVLSGPSQKTLGHAPLLHMPYGALHGPLPVFLAKLFQLSESVVLVAFRTACVHVHDPTPPAHSHFHTGQTLKGPKHQLTLTVQRQMHRQPGPPGAPLRARVPELDCTEGRVAPVACGHE